MPVEKNRMHFEKISHVAIAVNSIEEALKFYRDLLGLPLLKTEVVAQEEVHVAFLALGESRLELLAPTSPSSPVAKFLTKRGEGIHHLAIQTNNITESIEMLKASSLEFVEEAPRKGAGNSRIAFLHPKGTHGVLLELCEEGIETN